MSKELYASSPRPLIPQPRQTVMQRNLLRAPKVLGICQATDTPFLQYAHMAKELGAWDAVKACCPFCRCSGCCICDSSAYEPSEASNDKIRCDMRDFDARVKSDYQIMRIMYDKI